MRNKSLISKFWSNIKDCRPAPRLNRKDKLFLETLNRKAQINLSTFSLHQKTFTRFKNMYQGRDVVIFATGPSALKYKPVEGVIHIGVNAAFKVAKFDLDYIFFQDYLAGKGYLPELNAYNPDSCTKFYGLSDNYLYNIKFVVPETDAINANAIRYNTSTDNISQEFPYDISCQPLVGFGSVAFSAIQFALWTNPKNIYLVGCDCANNGYSYGGANCLNTSLVFEGYTKLKTFASAFYPGTKIHSINPVGLKGMFDDIYTE